MKPETFAAVTRTEGTDEAKWAQWMQRAREGDEVSYRQLLEELGTVIERYLQSRLGRLEFIEDIVQESLLAIHQARHTWNPARPFRPWLFAIVRHKSIDMLRRRNSRIKTVALESEEMGFLEQQVDYGGEQQLEGQQLFHGLKPEHRTALVLTRIVGLSTSEAAARCGISTVAMKVRVHRALKALARNLT